MSLHKLSFSFVKIRSIMIYYGLRKQKKKLKKTLLLKCKDLKFGFKCERLKLFLHTPHTSPLLKPNQGGILQVLRSLSPSSTVQCQGGCKTMQNMWSESRTKQMWNIPESNKDCSTSLYRCLLKSCET